MSDSKSIVPIQALIYKKQLEELIHLAIDLDQSESTQQAWNILYHTIRAIDLDSLKSCELCKYRHNPLSSIPCVVCIRNVRDQFIARKMERNNHE